MEPSPGWDLRVRVRTAGLVAVAVVIAVVGAALGVTAVVRLPARGTTCNATTALAQAAPSLVAIGSEASPRTTSGTMVRSNGVILTAAAAVTDTPGDVVATLSDGTSVLAELVGTDEATRLAVLKVALKQVPFLLPSPREDLSAGKPVVVLGSQLAEGAATLAGTAQAVGTTLELADPPGGRLEDAVVSDVAAVHGNLGAPVLDCEYRMVGVVVGSSSDGTAAVVPAGSAQRVVSRLLGLG